MSLMIDEPKFNELCRLIGLATLMSQKIQFALAHYHAFHKMVYIGMTKERAQQAIADSLKKTLGCVIFEVKKETPLDEMLAKKLDAFLKERNWLAHSFDHEATPIIAAGKDFGHFSSRMAGITQAAHDLMVELDKVGNTLREDG